jgi:hypothetical protein
MNVVWITGHNIPVISEFWSNYQFLMSSLQSWANKKQFKVCELFLQPNKRLLNYPEKKLCPNIFVGVSSSDSNTNHYIIRNVLDSPLTYDENQNHHTRDLDEH